MVRIYEILKEESYSYNFLYEVIGYSDEIRKKAIELYMQAMPISSIAVSLGIKVGSIYNWTKDLPKRKTPNVTDALRIRVKKLYTSKDENGKKKYTLQQIADLVNLSKTCVNEIIQGSVDIERRKSEVLTLDLTDKDLKDIVDRAKKGESFTSISKIYKCDKWFVSKIVKKFVSAEEYEEIIQRNTGTNSSNLKNKGVTSDLVKKWADAFAAGHTAMKIGQMFDTKVSDTNVLHHLRKLDNYPEILSRHNAILRGSQATTKIYRPGTIDNKKSKGPQSRHTQGVDWPNYNKGG